MMRFLNFYTNHRVCTVRHFSKIFLFLMFLNIQIDLIILKTDNEQFASTTKKALHITLNVQQYYSAFK